jgi:hypothetical protein
MSRQAIPAAGRRGRIFGGGAPAFFSIFLDWAPSESTIGRKFLRESGAARAAGSGLDGHSLENSGSST